MANNRSAQRTETYRMIVLLSLLLAGYLLMLRWSAILALWQQVGRVLHH